MGELGHFVLKKLHEIYKVNEVYIFYCLLIVKIHK